MNKPQDRLTSAMLVAVVLGAFGVSAPESAVASAVCPPPPDTLAGLISVDATETGPLTEQFRPIYGVYAEAAAECWGDTSITEKGFVASPEGLGGVSAFTIEPAWLVSREHFLSTTADIDPQAGPVGPFFPVAVPAPLEEDFTRLKGSWVTVSGHFHHAAAATCVVASSDASLGDVPTAEQAIEICRTSFVLTAISAEAVPATDSESVEPSPDRMPAWPGLIVVAFITLRLVLRRAPRTK
jgi:hypothetical protein